MGRLRGIEEVMSDARQRTGLSDFGDEGFRPGLEVLWAALEDDPHLVDGGRRAYERMVVDALSGFLTSEDGWRRHDGWRDTTIERPLFILGLPRTGTTALHKLIAQDPAMQSLPHWLGRHPQPRPPRHHWDGDSRYQETVAQIESLYAANPAMRAMHDMAADEADECRLLMVQNCAELTLASTACLPPYREWLFATDHAATYERYHRNLQLVASGDSRRWVLKDPGHLATLGALLQRFPDACLVQTHRAPEDAIPSVCSLVRGAVRANQPGLSAAALGEYTLELWLRVVEEGERARESVGTERFYDVDFRSFVADPIGEVERIYSHFGFDLSDDAREAMRRWHHDRPRGHRGEHRYTADDFGLTVEEIGERFAKYRMRHGLP